jgi:peptide/nickel transport system substrate-binding protein
MVDSIQSGMTSVADVFLDPADPEYRGVEAGVPRYPYDPARATQMIQELGYARGADGIFADASGQKIAVEIRSGVVEILQKTTISLADSWTRFGVSAEPLMVPPQRMSDRPYVWSFPGFMALRQGNTTDSLSHYRSSQAPLPENSFVGSNYGRYMNPELDGLLDAFFITIPKAERTDILRRIVYHISDQLPLMGLYYDVGIVFIGSRVRDISTSQSELWDIHRWDATT